MKIINIFLASSIDEFKNERNELQCFINDVAEDFRDRYDTDIRVQRCEKVDPRYVKGCSQDEFNELIKNSEMCIFLFFKKAGEYTIEEFEVARKTFEASENGKPKIYTYFKTIDNVSVDKSVTDFMSELDKNLKHFYQTFSHIDTVKLRVLLNLKMQEMDFISVEFDNGKCIVDGKETLDLSNVAEFANNGVLKQLNEEFLSIDKEYFEMKPIYATGKADEAFCKKYAEIATRRQNLLDTIEKLQRNIFNTSLRMCKDDVRGEITQRQREAYRLFELGDLDGCMSVLDSKDIDNDFLKVEKQIEEMAKKNAQKYIREHKTAIDILETMVNYRNRFNEIEERYEKIVPIAEKYMVELSVIYNYCSLLDNQNKSPKAYEFAKKLEGFYLLNKNKFEESEFAALYNLLGIICGNLTLHKEQEQYFKKAIEIREKLAEKNPERYNADLAMSYNNVGAFYDNLGNFKLAEYFFKRAIVIREHLALDNPKRYNMDLAESYDNFGIFYSYQCELIKAENFILKAIKIREELVLDNLGRYYPELAHSYRSAGNFYCTQGIEKKTEYYYKKAIMIMEHIAKENPEKYSADLAMYYNNTGSFYCIQGNVEQAEYYYKKSIMIMEQFTLESVRSYKVNLATIYNNMANFYYILSKMEQAEYYYKKAIAIMEQFALKNAENYKASLATIYNATGNFYSNKNDAKQAKYYYKKAIEIRKQLAEDNPERYSANLATSYYNYGIFTDNEDYFDKALALAKTQPDNPYCRQIISTLGN